MKLKKVFMAVISLTLLVGGSVINPTYAANQQGQALTKATYQIIAPLWTSISIISPDISANGKNSLSRGICKS